MSNAYDSTRKEVKPIKRQLAKIARKIECPRCQFNYVEYKNGQKLIVSPCGWELCYIEGPKDDMDIEEPDYSELDN